MLPVLLAVALHAGLAAGEPSNQTVVFYNARAALREKKPAEVLKLWLLRNALASDSGAVSESDEDFRSLVWAALGELGLCQDGYAHDGRGAGLWPLAFFNYAVRNLGGSEPPERPAPFDAFEVARQQRFVSLRDVLAPAELRSVNFFRTACWLPSTMMLVAGQGFSGDLKDRRRTARLLRHVLKTAHATLAKEKIESTAAIDARIFDLNLLLEELNERAAVREARATARQARVLGVSREGAEELKKAEELRAFEPSSEEALLLSRALSWSTDEWLTLSRDRRLFIYSHAKRQGPSKATLDAVALALIDALVVHKQGDEVEQWIGFLGGEGGVNSRGLVFAGERGQTLLALDKESGFRERAVIALHRGVGFLEAGDLRESLRSFAYALRFAEESREADKVLGLSRRWLSYVVGRHETSDELLKTLAALVPKQDYGFIVEDLVWRAALAADDKSFTACARGASGRGAFELRMERLRPLAHGKLGEFTTNVRDGLLDEPHATIRFLRQFLERLEAEDGDVRAVHKKTLESLIALLVPLTPARGQKGAQARSADELVQRMEAVLDGLERIGTKVDGARELSPASEVFAGSVRLAPADPLPWPFAPPEVRAPSAFAPFALTPIEWRDASGKLVFGWRIGE